MNRRPLLYFAIGFYLVTIAYPMVRIRTWYEASNDLSALLATALAVVLIATPFLFFFARFVLGWRPEIKGLPVLYSVIGSSYLAFPVVVSIELLRFLPGWPTDQTSLVAITVTLVLVSISVWQGIRVTVSPLLIHSDGKLRDTSLVQLSDVHIGSRSKQYLEKVIAKVNQLHPDWVVITGDLIDSDKVTASDLEPLKNLKAPTWMVVGNHERYEGLDHVTNLIRTTGMTLLRNENVCTEKVQFVGIDDNDSPRFLQSQLGRFDPSPNHYKILLYHRPHGYEEASQWGFNLMLCGHTHRGQIFPFNAIVRRFFKLTHGLHQIGEMRLYISTGTGTWGPILRLGSKNEITHIQFT